jgi:hypothetical protein
MLNSKRAEYVSCVVCGESIEYRIYNKHWAHTPGHRTHDRPRPPKTTTNWSNAQVDEGESVHASDPPLGFEIDTPIVDEFENDNNSPAPLIPPSTTEERVPGAGTRAVGRRWITIGHPSIRGEIYVHPKIENRQWFKEFGADSPYYPYSSYNQFRLAASVASPKLLPANVIQKVAVDGGDAFIPADLAFSSTNDFLARIDQLSALQSTWRQGTLTNQRSGVSWATDVKFWHRDPLAVLQEIFENPDLKDSCVWEPVKQYNSEGDRVYTDMYTGDWWWRLQVSFKCQLK